VSKVKLFHQLTKFALVGSVNGILDIIIYFWLTRYTVFWSHRLFAANFLAFVITAIVNYYMNTWWTFDKGHHSPAAVFKHSVVNLTSFAIYMGLFYWMIDAHWNDLWAKLVLSFIVFVWSFVLSKLWVYNKIHV